VSAGTWHLEPLQHVAQGTSTYSSSICKNTCGLASNISAWSHNLPDCNSFTISTNRQKCKNERSYSKVSTYALVPKHGNGSQSRSNSHEVTILAGNLTSMMLYGATTVARYHGPGKSFALSQISLSSFVSCAVLLANGGRLGVV
jgi:hypothetical protein